jgi:hypothetical protein
LLGIQFGHNPTNIYTLAGFDFVVWNALTFQRRQAQIRSLIPGSVLHYTSGNSSLPLCAAGIAHNDATF